MKLGLSSREENLAGDHLTLFDERATST